MKTRNQLFVGLVTVLSLFQVSAKAQEQLQKIIPVSPNAAAIAKYGETPVGHFTGVPNIQLPLYSIKSRDLSLDLNLGYHAGGNKVEDIASWVGLGWTLSGVPTISRSVRGIPDDHENGYWGKYNGLTVQQLRDSNYLSEAVNEMNFRGAIHTRGIDTEADIFSFTLPNKSGKFFWNQQTEMFQCSPYDGIKISYNGQGFTIVDTDGLIYYFNIAETSQTSGSTPIKTSWLSSVIYNPTRTDSIRFEYNSETQLINTLNPVSVSVYGTVPSGAVTSASNTNAYVISKIIFSKGYVMFLRHNEGREDLNGGKALEHIKVYNNNGLLVKHYKFKYGYRESVDCPSGFVYEGKRLLLKDLSELGYGGEQGQQYRFLYDSSISAPCRVSAAQDYWGYYNGKTANTTLVPKAVVSVPGIGSFEVNGSNRSVDPAFSQFAILKRIVYPTGGYSDFEYENHSSQSPDIPANYISKSAYLFGEQETPVHTTYIDTFNIASAPDTYLNMGNGGVYASINFYNLGCDISSGGSTCAQLFLRGLDSTNASINTTITYALNGYHLPNGRYEMKAVFNQSPALYDGFQYIVSWREVDSAYLNKRLIGGVRVRKIADFTAGQLTQRREYQYINSLDEPQLSSGDVFGKSYLVGPVDYYTAVNNGAGGYTWNYSYGLAAQSTATAVSHSGSFTGYNSVFERRDSLGNAGITQYEFLATKDVVTATSPFPPASSFMEFRGQPLRTTQFKRNVSGMLQPVHRTYYSYLDKAFDSLTIVSLKVRAVKDPIFAGGEMTEAPMYDMSYYETSPLLRRVAQQKERIYDASDTTLYVETNVDYTYSNAHFQLTETTSYDSRQVAVTNHMVYPADEVLSGESELARQSLIEQNRIASVLKQTKKVGGNLVGTITNQYKRFGSGTLVYPSEIISVKGALGDSSSVRFLKYQEGNLQEQQKQDDIVLSYIWDYENNYPVAEVHNALSDDIAFTSFESNGKGYWNYTSTGVKQGEAIAGNKSFKLSEGSIERTGLNSAKTYVISYWAKGGSVNINGSGGGTSMVSRDGWTLYRSSLTGVSSVTMSGSGYIDELRLYPLGAQMSTYTYEPLVGVTTQTDVNNGITYYYYDHLQRLTLIKDQDKNIIKQICYQYYDQTPLPCEDPSIPNWVNEGSASCETLSGYANGKQVQLQRDINVSSITYNQTRLVDLGTNTSACPVVADWQATGSYRCVTNLGYNTGAQERQEQDHNPVTNSGYRWVDNGTNTTACAVIADWQATGSYRCVTNSGYNTGAQERQEQDHNPVTNSGYRWVDNGTNTTACAVAADWQVTGNYRCVKNSGYNTGTQEREEQDQNPVTNSGTRWVANGTNTGACPVAADWQGTSNYRCVKNSGYNTGTQEREEQDQNPVTNSGTRWVDNGTNGTACPVAADWQGTGNYRCVKNSGYNTGTQEREEQDQNPVTNSGTRWVDNGTNGTACPVAADWQITSNYRCVKNSGYNTGGQEREESDHNPVTNGGTRWVNNGTDYGACPVVADWQITGNYRCVKNSGYNTGGQEREESDHNPVTNGGTRWVSNGANTGACPVVADWQGTGNYRCVKNSGYNTGEQEREESDHNPVTNGGTRWVSNGANTGACPVVADWQITGNYRCVQNSGYNTGGREREELDHNPVTGGGYRWVNNGTNLSACPVEPDWQYNSNYRCVTTSGSYLTGEQERQQYDHNPNTAYGYRWISQGTNYSACPLTPDWQNTGTVRCETDGASHNSGYQEIQQHDHNPVTNSGYRWVQSTYYPSACPLTPDWQFTGTYRCINDGTYNTGQREGYQHDVNPYTNSGYRWAYYEYNLSICPIVENWQPTGNYRCVTSSGYNTGERQREEMDMNPYGPGDTRWVSLGTNTSACPVNPDWVNTGSTRCVQSGGQNTGQQEAQQYDQNPVTANGYRWLNVGTNTSACPIPTVYAAISYENTYMTFEGVIVGDVLVRTYSDAGYSTPTNSSVTINYRIWHNCNGYSYQDYNQNMSGSSYAYLASFTWLSYPNPWCYGDPYCMYEECSYLYELLSGTGYQ